MVNIVREHRQQYLKRFILCLKRIDLDKQITRRDFLRLFNAGLPAKYNLYFEELTYLLRHQKFIHVKLDMGVLFFSKKSKPEEDQQ